MKIWQLLLLAISPLFFNDCKPSKDSTKNVDEVVTPVNNPTKDSLFNLYVATISEILRYLNIGQKPQRTLGSIVTKKG